MKKKVFSLFIAFVFVFITAIPTTFALSDKTVSDVTGVILKTSENTEETKTVSYKTTLSQTGLKPDAIQALKQLRSQMWDENVPFDGSTLQQVAKSKGYNTKDEYVNGFTWDADLERIAIQRAAESAVHGKIDHKRTNSDDVFSAKVKNTGRSMNAEILAWGYANIASAIIDGWGNGEKQALIANDGNHNAANGHLYTLINPRNKAYGFSYIPDGPRGRTYQGSASQTPATDTDSAGIDGTVNLDVSVSVDELNYGEQQTTQEEIPFGEATVENDPNQYTDYQETIPGENGIKEVTKSEVSAFGKVLETTVISEKITKNPKNPIIKKGTKPIMSTKTIDVDENVDFGTDPDVEDPSQYTDYKELITEGVNGVDTVTYKVTYNKDVEVEREEIGRTVKTAPINKKYKVGTKPIYTTEIKTESVVVPFEKKTENDDTMYVGETKPKQAGVNGKADVQYEYKYKKGEFESKTEVGRQITVAPVDEIMLVGTKVRLPLDLKVRPKSNCLDGDNTWNIKDTSPLVFRANANMQDLTEVKVDGKEISDENYTLESGSTILTLKPEYLKTLSIGKHTLSMTFNQSADYKGGTVSKDFVIKDLSNQTQDNTDENDNDKIETVEKKEKNKKSPKTGVEKENYLLLIFISLPVGAAYILLSKNKNKAR